ncbi:DUF362 domain-containing protein [candidate division KSB1 bacterium]|nr:DUF362 domain-containing protein [candidate division KSB1 bacterium]
MKRRDFIKQGLKLGSAAYGALSLNMPGMLFANDKNKMNLPQDLALVKNGDPTEMVAKAFDMFGGVSKFVKKGDTVVVKPNIGWARRPEQAANTNPEIVAAIIKLCDNAGASKIKVFDNTCNETKRCYRLSGIEQAAKEAGAKVNYIFPQKFKRVRISKGKALTSWEFYSDVLEADVYINVPIAKHHSLARVTLGLKNTMGIIGGNRGAIHNNFDQKLADLNTVVRPTITIIDAVRVLMRNGPQGGNLNDVKQMNTVIAGIDPVAVDSFGATLFDLKGNDLGYIRKAHELGLGEIDLNKLKIATADLSA